MKNDNSGKHKENKIIPFPRLKDRLFEKGMNALQQKSYQEALPAFKQLKEMDQSYPQVQAGIVICLLELGKLDEAKVESKRLLQEGIGDYFENLQIYITVLIQLNEYKEAVATLEAVIEEHKLPHDMAEQLYQLLDFSRKMTEGNDRITEPEPPIEEQQLSGLILTPVELKEKMANGKTEDQLKGLQLLRQLDLAPFLPVIQEILIGSFAPELKTMLLEILLEKNVDRQMRVTKFGKTKEIIPQHLDGVFEEGFVQEVLNMAEQNIEHENPALFQMIKEIWHRHLFIVYPFTPTPENSLLWAAALHKFGSSLHGLPIDDEEVAAQYGINVEELTEAAQYLSKLEEAAFNGIK